MCGTDLRRSPHLESLESNLEKLRVNTVFDHLDETKNFPKRDEAAKEVIKVGIFKWKELVGKMKRTGGKKWKDLVGKRTEQNKVFENCGKICRTASLLCRPCRALEGGTNNNERKRNEEIWRRTRFQGDRDEPHPTVASSYTPYMYNQYNFFLKFCIISHQPVNCEFLSTQKTVYTRF